MHSIQQIMNNQSEFKKEIMFSLNLEMKKAKKDLFSIKSDDDFITSSVVKLKKRFKKAKYKKELDKLFFSHPKRNEEFYAWWDIKNKEVIILNYAKK